MPSKFCPSRFHSRYKHVGWAWERKFLHPKRSVDLTHWSLHKCQNNIYPCGWKDTYRQHRSFSLFLPKVQQFYNSTTLSQNVSTLSQYTMAAGPVNKKQGPQLAYKEPHTT